MILRAEIESGGGLVPAQGAQQRDPLARQGAAAPTHSSGRSSTESCVRNQPRIIQRGPQIHGCASMASLAGAPPAPDDGLASIGADRGTGTLAKS